MFWSHLFTRLSNGLSWRPHDIEHTCVQYSSIIMMVGEIWGVCQGYERLFYRNSNSMENWFSCNCRCHIVMKLTHSDHFTTTCIIADWNFHRPWITMETLFVKLAPDLCHMWAFASAALYVVLHYNNIIIARAITGARIIMSQKNVFGKTCVYKKMSHCYEIS